MTAPFVADSTLAVFVRPSIGSEPSGGPGLCEHRRNLFSLFRRVFLTLVSSVYFTLPIDNSEAMNLGAL